MSPRSTLFAIALLAGCLCAPSVALADELVTEEWTYVLAQALVDNGVVDAEYGCFDVCEPRCESEFREIATLLLDHLTVLSETTYREKDPAWIYRSNNEDEGMEPGPYREALLFDELLAVELALTHRFAPTLLPIAEQLVDGRRDDDAVLNQILGLKRLLSLDPVDEHLLQLELPVLLAYKRTDPEPVYDDVPSNHWAYEVLNDLAERGMLEGYPEGFFDGRRVLMWYEFARVIARLLDAVSDNHVVATSRDLCSVERLRLEFADVLKGFSVECFEIHDIEDFKY